MAAATKTSSAKAKTAKARKATRRTGRRDPLAIRLLKQDHREMAVMWARVRAALPSLKEGATPRVRRIDAELQIANESPGRTMAVLLGPGEQPGEVVATIKVDEQPVQRFSVSLDNTGNERTGRWRLGLGGQHADLTGHDDTLSLQVQTSPTEASAVQAVPGRGVQGTADGRTLVLGAG